MVQAIPAQCETNADCTRQGGAFARSTCSAERCVPPPSGSGGSGASDSMAGWIGSRSSDAGREAEPDAIYRVKTTYLEGAVAFYLVDSARAGTLARLTETDHVTPGDFLFHVTPGLANPSDPSLVSFESVSSPGYYLRIDSANLTSATRAVTAGAYAWDMNFDYDHVTWFDAFANTAAFKADATFTMTAALNGDATLVSFQWYNDKARYLRHQRYHVFALPPATDQENIDSSFAFEVQPRQ
jgi:hypothetical protein